MSIPSQLPQIVTAARSSALQALALQAGQVLEGKVLGPAPNGGTQIEIAGQKLNLLLPTPIKAGETIKLEVQSTGAQIRLTLQAATIAPTAATPASANAAPMPPANLPLPPVAAAPPQATIQPAPQASMTARPLPQQTQAPLPGGRSMPTATIQQGPPLPAAPQAMPQAPVAAPTPSTTPTPLLQVQAAPVTNIALATVPASGTSAPASPIPNATPLPAGSVASPAPMTPSVTPQLASLPTQAYVRAAAIAPPSVAPVASMPVGAIATGGMPTTTASPQSPAPTVATPAAPQASAPSTPQAALAQMVQAAVPRQDGVTSLTTALTAIAGKVVLPEPVVKAAQQVLAGRVVLDGAKFDGAALQKAVLGSGVFQEASMAKGALPMPQTDMKAALLTLSTTLTSWLGQQTAIVPAGRLAPPLRGVTPRAGKADAPALDPSASPTEVGKQLLDRTEAALSRLRLHQNASLPDPTGKLTADWSMDMPVIIGSQQTLLHIQLHRDQQGSAEDIGERGWQMRFALSVPELGEVGAQVSLRGANTGVMLWATDPEASAALEAEIGQLRDALAGAGLRPGAVIVRHGEPPAPAVPAASGHFVDSRT